MSVKEFLETIYKLNLVSPDKIREGYLLYQTLLQKKHSISIEQVFLQKNYLSEKQISQVKNTFEQNRSQNISLSQTQVQSSVIKQSNNFGRYRIIEEIGHGGMGVVYKAYDQNLKREIALKIIAQIISSDKQRERFEREARLMSKLSHSHIIKIFDAGCEQNRLYLTMELIRGKGFDEYLKENHTLENMLNILIKVAHAVHYAHKQEIIHRDLKPSNIMIDETGEPKVMDFGLAKEIESGALSKSMDIIGTPQYMSPEQASSDQKKIDRRSDVYALGIILYEIITGKTPFTGDPVNILYQISFNDPVPPSHFHPNLSKDLEAICLKSIEKNKKGRYASAQAFSRDIQAYLEGNPVTAKPLTALGTLGRTIKKYKMISALIVCIITLILSLIIYMHLSKIEVINSNKKLAQANTEIKKQKQKAIELAYITKSSIIISNLSTIILQLRYIKIYIQNQNYSSAYNMLQKSIELHNHVITSLKTLRKSMGVKFIRENSIIKENLNNIEERKHFVSKAIQDIQKYCIDPYYQQETHLNIPKGELTQTNAPSWRYFVYGRRRHLCIWDRKKRIFVKEYILRRTPYFITHSPNDKYIGIAGRGEFFIWNTQTQKLSHKKFKNPTGVNKLQFSPNNQYLFVSQAGPGVGEKYLLQLKDLKIVMNNKDLAFQIPSETYMVDFSNDNKWLILGSEKLKSLVINLTTCKKEKNMYLKFRTGCFGIDNKTIIAGNVYDISIYPFSLAQQKKGYAGFGEMDERRIITHLGVHNGDIMDIEKSHNQDFFASLGNGRKMIIWNAYNNKKIFETIIASKGNVKIHFHPRNSEIGVWDHSGVRLHKWDLNLKRKMDLKQRKDIRWGKFQSDFIKKISHLSVLQKKGRFIIQLKFSPYGRYLGYYMFPELYLYDMKKDQFQFIHKHSIGSQSMRFHFSKDNRFLLWKLRKKYFVFDIQNKKRIHPHQYMYKKGIQIFQAQTNNVINCFQPKKRGKNFIYEILTYSNNQWKQRKRTSLNYFGKVFSRQDGNMLAIYHPETLTLWDIKNNKKILIQMDNTQHTFTFIDTERFAIGNEKGNVTIYNYKKNKTKKLYHFQVKDHIEKIYYNTQKKHFWIKGNTRLYMFPDIENSPIEKEIKNIYPLPIYPAYTHLSTSINHDFTMIAFARSNGEILLFELDKK